MCMDNLLLCRIMNITLVHRGRRGRDWKEVEFITTYAISTITTNVASSNSAQARSTRYNIM
jgi:hypothetical protein